MRYTHAAATRKRMAAAVAAGIPEPDDAVCVFQIGPKGKLHQSSACTRLSGKVAAAVPISFVPADWLGTKNSFAATAFCDSCASSATEAARRWLDGVEVYLSALRVRDELAATDGVTLAEVDRATSSLRSLCGDGKTDTGLALLANTLLHELGSLRSGLDLGSLKDQVLVKSALWALDEGSSLGFPEIEDYDFVNPSDDRHSYHNSGPAPLRTAWSVLQDRLNDGAGLDEAVEAATTAGQAEVRTDHCDWERVPAVAVLDSAQFAHPREWAIAEWRRAALAEVETLVQVWADDFVVTAAESGISLIVVHPYEPGTALHTSLADIVGPFGVVTGNNETAWVELPRPVARWAAGLGHGTGSHYVRHSVLEVSDQPVDATALELVAGFDDIGPQLRDGGVEVAKKALETALLLSS